LEITLNHILRARNCLKQLLEAGVEAVVEPGPEMQMQGGKWQYETAEYRFCRLSAEIVRPPSYGFGVEFKQLGCFGYWFRDRSSEAEPLRAFSCNSEFQAAKPLVAKTSVA